MSIQTLLVYIVYMPTLMTTRPHLAAHQPHERHACVQHDRHLGFLVHGQGCGGHREEEEAASGLVCGRTGQYRIAGVAIHGGEYEGGQVFV
jgi:hypothetical protein